MAGETIRREDFDLSRLEPHLKLRLEIVDDSGRVKKATREVETAGANRPLATPVSQVSLDQLQPNWYRNQMTTWDVDSIPRSMVTQEHGLRLERFVALVDHQTWVRPELFDVQRNAEATHFYGLLRLFCLADHRELRSQIQHLPRYRDCQLWLSDRLGNERLRGELESLLAKLAFLPDGYQDRLLQERSSQAFQDRRLDRVRKLSMAAAEVGKWLPKTAEHYHTLRLSMQPNAPATWKAALDDIRKQLGQLFEVRFMIDSPWDWIKEYPRYLQAIKHRIDRLKTAGVGQDTQSMARVHEYWSDYERRLKNDSTHVAIPLIAGQTTAPVPIGLLSEYRWMIEEYRVSLFAQQLGTRQSVSPKRLDKLRSELDA